MPKGQLLFSAVFGFRNPTKEIFSESDEINAQDLKIPGSFQSTEERPEGSQGGPTPQGGAPLVCGSPVAPPTPPLRLFRPP